MYAPFDSLDNAARIWIYQSSRKISAAERSTISEVLSAFTHTWVAHGSPLKTSFTILHDQFIILAADENFHSASGCSIDSSVRVIRQLDEQFSLGLFERTNVAFFKNEEIEIIPLNELGKALKEVRWDENTAVFNNSITVKGELKTNWIVSAAQTWLTRYLTKKVV